MSTPADPRRLRWDACHNVRDLGGFPTRHGSTRWGAIVRSDNICRLTRHGRQALVRHGVRTVIDLRSDNELGLENDPFHRGDLDEVGYAQVALWTDAVGARHAAEPDRRFENVVLDAAPGAIAALFTAIAAAPAGGVLIFCHAGKERTGIAAALVLAIAGVPRALISSEYALSDVYLEPLFEAWLAAAEPAARAGVEALRVTRDDRMALVLAEVDERYGGVEPYLLSTGLDARDLHRARERLVS